MKFSIPYNGYNSFITKMMKEYKNEIHEVYLAPSKLISATGRSHDGYNKNYFETPKEYEQKITDMLVSCEQCKVKANFLFNGVFSNFDFYTEEGFEQLCKYIDNVYKKIYLTGITLVDPYLIKPLSIIRDKEWPDLEIHASVNMYSNTINRISMLEELGVDNICIDRDINRNMQLLQTIAKNTKSQVKLMVNEGCLLGCPFRKHHHERKEVYTGSTEFIVNVRKSLVARFEEPISSNLAFCLKHYQDDNSQIFRSPFIRPEDLHYYEDIVDIFKIVGREMTPDRLGEIIQAYVTRTYTGNLWKLIFRFSDNIPFYIDNKKIPADFHEKMVECDDNCSTCNYCTQLISLIEKKDRK